MTQVSADSTITVNPASAERAAPASEGGARPATSARHGHPDDAGAPTFASHHRDVAGWMETRGPRRWCPIGTVVTHHGPACYPQDCWELGVALLCAVIDEAWKP